MSRDPVISKNPVSPDVAIIVPTFNEVDNVEELLRRLVNVLAGEAFEVIFVDDNSADGTADALRQLAKNDPRVRCIERVGRRGLSTAVIEGIMSTVAAVAVVMDADLQHDESIIPEMLADLRGHADVVVGTRYSEGGGIGDWSDERARKSRLATRLSRILKVDNVSDPMSGFFAVKTEVFRQRVAGLDGSGYKILLDFLSTPGQPLAIAERPYHFRARQHGESKLDSKVMLEFLELLLAKSVGRFVPTKFVMFSLVGALGVFVHFAVLSLALGYTTFGLAQSIATFVAMTANFFVNNWFTYFDARLKGWQLLPGWLSFCFASAVGAIANVGVSLYLFSEIGLAWYVAALAGIIIGAVWNYAITALYTWKA